MQNYSATFEDLKGAFEMQPALSAPYDMFSPEMWTSEDPAPQLLIVSSPERAAISELHW